MNKPSYFFDPNYVGNDVIVNNFAYRGFTKKSSFVASEICNLNNRYSVRSAVPISAGDLIESAPYTVMQSIGLSKEPERALAEMNNMFVLEDFSEFTKQNGPRLVIAGGNAPFYRHSQTPNAYVVFDHVGKVLHIKALEMIPEAHEITLYRFGSLQILKNNLEIQKFYAERQKQVQEKNINTSSFRSMNSTEVQNIETIEIKANDTV
jgi:hypothetical protein